MRPCLKTPTTPWSSSKSFFGLNKYEAKAYIALLKRPMATSEISEAAKIPKPRVYDVARSLESKGFARSSGGKYYAISPEIALPARRAAFRAQFEEEDTKRLQAQQMLVEALRGYGEHPVKEPVILRGLHQIAGLLYQILPQCSQIYLTINRALEARTIFRTIVKEAASSGKRPQIFALIPSDTKLEAEDLELIEMFGAQVRLAAGVLLDTMVTDRDDVVIGLPDPGSAETVPVVGVYVKDHAFASSIQQTFRKAWATAKEIAT